MVQLSVKQTTFLAALAVWVVLLTVTSAVPLEEIEDADDDIKRSILWARLLRATERLNPTHALVGDRQLGQFASRRFSEQKRYRPAMQSRSGGMSLCLWKVCPAAPWLVTKRESNNDY